MTGDELKEVIRLHKLWRAGLPDGKRADLRRANLSGACLRGADLRRADLRGAYLRGAYLRGADLRGANLSGACLRVADLRRANLSGACLRGANLRGANLSDGESWDEYLSDVVPALLTAGGKTLDDVIGCGSFECHTWENCPMHAAFGIKGESAGPPLLVPRIRQFVQFFDAGLIRARRSEAGRWKFYSPEYKGPVPVEPAPAA